MKAIIAASLFVASCLALSGCESDLPPDATSHSGPEKIRRGLTGQGALIQPDRSEDPLIREQSRVGY